MKRWRRGSVVPVPEPEAADLRAHFEEVVRLLSRDSRLHRQRAWVIGAIGLVGLVIAAVLGWIATGNGLDTLKNASGYRREVLLFELVRTAAAAALLGAFVWGTLNLARAALDQSTRYEKRLVPGHFLAYVLRKFEAEIKAGTILLPDVMAVFKAWSDSVDSAFTHVKYGSRKNQDVAISATKNGIGVATGDATVPSPTS
jgi:hypothetical protein